MQGGGGGGNDGGFGRGLGVGKWLQWGFGEVLWVALVLEPDARVVERFCRWGPPTNVV